MAFVQYVHEANVIPCAICSWVFICLPKDYTCTMCSWVFELFIYGKYHACAICSWVFKVIYYGKYCRAFYCTTIT